MRTSLAEDLDATSWRSASPSSSSRPLASSERISVVITIDAEIAPHTSNWRRDRGRFAADRDIYGITERGERGLRYQLDVIERHEAVVSLVQDRGHEIGLHIHTEWLPFYQRPLLGDRYGRNMSDFSEDD